MNYIHQVEPFIGEREVEAMQKYLRSGGWLTEFRKTEELERRIEDFLGIKYAVMVTSGTVALYLILRALDISSDDTVSVPDYTMIASPNTVKWTGAKVSLTDIRKKDLCLDLEKVSMEAKALLYVSVNGRSGPIKEIQEFCEKHDLYLIEDACQSFGSKKEGQFLGTFGEAGAFSFSPHKIITTGQGGAVVTDNKDIYEEVKALKNFSRKEPGVDEHTGLGYNFKFTDLQATIGIEQLKTIDFRIKRKRLIYEFYKNKLSSLSFIEFLPFNFLEEVPWFIDIILHDVNRASFISYLEKHGIGSRPFYPPIHTQEPYPNGEYLVASKVARKGLWLPSSIGLDLDKLNYITKMIRDFRG